MEAGLVYRLGHDGTQAAHDFRADGDAQQCRAAFRLVPLASGQDGWHNHRAGVYRPAFKRIVEILAVRRGAVDECRSRGAERAGMADSRARPLVIAAGERASDVSLVAGSDAESDHINEQILALSTHGGGQIVGAQRGNRRSELLGNGSLRQSGAHDTFSIRTSRRAAARRRISDYWQAPRWQT